MKRRYLIAVFSICTAMPAVADIVVPGADGSDGALTIATNTNIDLSIADTGTWDGANPNPGQGVYDPDEWAVVFRYTSVTVNSGATLTYTNHPSKAPVVWLVSGSVTINGSVSLDGAAGHSSSGPVALSPGGPGGFRGGRGQFTASSPVSAGFGPGGTINLANNNWAYGGSHGTLGLPGSGPSSAGPVYENAGIVPLLGGSGGTGYLRGPGSTNTDGGGGGGGGALMIASTGIISINGQVRANGGASGPTGSGGSGGALRLIADQVTGSGMARALGGAGQGVGGSGRIRVETNLAGTLSCVPVASYGTVGAAADPWPPEDMPTIRVTLVHNQNVPIDPNGSFEFPGADVSLTNPNPMIVRLECANVPTPVEPPAATVMIRVIPLTGQDFLVNATYVSGDIMASIWEAQVQLADGFSAIQARAMLP